MDLRSCHTFDPPPLLCVSPLAPHLLPPSRLSLDNGLLLTMSKLPRKVSPALRDSASPPSRRGARAPLERNHPPPRPHGPRGAGRDPPTPGPRRAWPARPRCPRTVTWRAERRPGDSSKKLSARRRQPWGPLSRPRSPSATPFAPTPNPCATRRLRPRPASSPDALAQPGRGAGGPGAHRAGGGGGRAEAGAQGAAGVGVLGPGRTPALGAPGARRSLCPALPQLPTVQSPRAAPGPGAVAEGGSPASPAATAAASVPFPSSFFSPGLEPQRARKSLVRAASYRFSLLGLACLRLCTGGHPP